MEKFQTAEEVTVRLAKYTCGKQTPSRALGGAEWYLVPVDEEDRVVADERH